MVGNSVVAIVPDGTVGCSVKDSTNVGASVLPVPVGVLVVDTAGAPVSKTGVGISVGNMDGASEERLVRTTVGDAVKFVVGALVREGSGTFDCEFVRRTLGAPVTGTFVIISIGDKDG
jgi:hypothetical protein